MTLRRIVAYLLVLSAMFGSVGGLATRPATAAPQGTADYVIVAGAAGLRWDDVDPVRTPTLWQTASRGSVGWLSVRSGHRTTCPQDGWLTLGAGNYAAWDTNPVVGQCPPTAPEVQRPDGIGANLPNQQQLVRDNQARAYGAVPGALAESVRCTVAVGPGAAVAAARPFGRVDRYEPALPADPAPLLSDCVLSIVDLGTVAGEGPARQRAAARADAVLARVLAYRPPRTLVLVAGLADTDSTSRLHVAMADGPGWSGGWLTSAGTGRDGYLQLVDLAPTALSALGRSAPQRLFAGKPASMVPGRPGDLAQAVSGERDADRRAGAQRQVADPFFIALAVVQLLLFVFVVPLMVRARRHAGPTGPASPPRAVLRSVELLLIAAALVIPAALVTDAVPWWRAAWPGVVFSAITALLVAAGTAAVRFAPRYGRTLQPMALVAAIDVAVVVADLFTGARLQLNGVAGYSALEGSRYAGVGGVGLGVLTAGALVLAGCLASAVRKPRRPLLVVVFGAFVVMLVGSPYFGADPVGAIAVTAGVCVAAATSAGGWLTFPRFAWATVAGLAVTIGFATLDLSRPDADRGSLGQFLTALGNGTAGPAVQRAAAANLRALLDSPLTLLAVVSALMLLFAHFSPWGGIKRLFGLHPTVRAVAAGTTVAVLLAGVLGGSALGVAGAAAAATVPMVALTVLRVLDHAADRTPAPGDTDGPGGPGLSTRLSDNAPLLPVIAARSSTGKPDAEGLTARTV